MSIKILLGDCRERLRELPDGSVHSVVTSPPYFGLRDYGADGQIGLEPTPDEFVEAMVEVFGEVRRVLRDDGTLWLNLGDSYARNPAKGKSGTPNGRNVAEQGYAGGGGIGAEIKEKDLIGIPWMVAFALRAAGWYLRQEIIWSKPNTMPESVRDRCTKSHEHIFLLAKSARYYYDAEAIAEEAQDWSTSGPGTGIKETDHYGAGNGGNGGLAKLAARYKSSGNKARKPRPGSPESHTGNAAGSIPWEGNTRNKRSVWTVPPQAFNMEMCKGCERIYDLSEYRALRREKQPENKPDRVFCKCGEHNQWLSHFATFPPDLIEPCVLAGCPEQCCAECGAPVERIITKGEPDEEARARCGADSSGGYGGHGKNDPSGKAQNPSDLKRRILDGMRLKQSSFEPTCDCQAGFIAGTVLDPFGGAGTTALVADRLGRSAILTELNHYYVALAQERLKRDGGMFTTIAVEEAAWAARNGGRRSGPRRAANTSWRGSDRRRR